MDRIILNNVSKKFKIGSVKNQTALLKLIFLVSGRGTRKTFWANKDISLTVPAGKIIGLIGSNGAGKSTLLRIIAGIIKPDEGQVKITGKVIAMINLASGLKERLSMDENIYLLCSLLGLTRKETREKYNDIVNFTELANYTNAKIYQLSNGMVARLIVSVAIFCNPDILLIDEVFGSSDKHFRIKSFNKIKDLTFQGTSVILVSHEYKFAKEVCEIVYEIKDGQIIKRANKN